MLIKIERISDDRLSRQVWDFTALTDHVTGPLNLRLDGWTSDTRQTRRHKWQQEGEGYVRRSHNGGVHFRGRRLPAEQVPFSDDVVNEAKQVLLSRLVVIGPEDPPPEKYR